MASLYRSSLRLRSVARLPAARALSTTAQLRAAEKPYFPDEPTAPTVATAIPGPKNKAAMAELDKVFDVRSLNMLTDYTKSIGN
jgi:4-aminobutyrate aminotransferase/(S)-3-amino-2-methylpropionate transaminase